MAQRAPIDRHGEVFRRARPHLFDFRFVRDPLRLKAGREDFDGIARRPFFLLRLRLVMARIASRVAGLAIGQELEQNRPVTGSAPCRRAFGRCIDRLNVVAVRRLASDSILGRAVGDARISHHEIDPSPGTVQIVLADEDRRQPPDCGHVHAFVEGAFGHRAIAEEAGDDPIALLHLERQRHARRERNAAADDGDAGNHALAHVADMHRTALAFAAAGRSSEQFVEELLLAKPFGDGMAMAAERRSYEIVSPQSGADADRRRLLALALVDGAGHGAFEEQEAYALLEFTDPDHPVEEIELPTVVEGRAHASTSIRAMTSPIATFASGAARISRTVPVAAEFDLRRRLVGFDLEQRLAALDPRALRDEPALDQDIRALCGRQIGHLHVNPQPIPPSLACARRRTRPPRRRQTRRRSRRPSGPLRRRALRRREAFAACPSHGQFL